MVRNLKLVLLCAFFAHGFMYPASSSRGFFSSILDFLGYGTSFFSTDALRPEPVDDSLVISYVGNEPVGHPFSVLPCLQQRQRIKSGELALKDASYNGWECGFYSIYHALKSAGLYPAPSGAAGAASAAAAGGAAAGAPAAGRFDCHEYRAFWDNFVQKDRDLRARYPGCRVLDPTVYSFGARSTGGIELPNSEILKLIVGLTILPEATLDTYYRNRSDLGPADGRFQELWASVQAAHPSLFIIDKDLILGLAAGEDVQPILQLMRDQGDALRVIISTGAHWICFGKIPGEQGLYCFDSYQTAGLGRVGRDVTDLGELLAARLFRPADAATHALVDRMREAALMPQMQALWDAAEDKRKKDEALKTALAASSGPAVSLVSDAPEERTLASKRSRAEANLEKVSRPKAKRSRKLQTTIPFSVVETEASAKGNTHVFAAIAAYRELMEDDAITPDSICAAFGTSVDALSKYDAQTILEMIDHEHDVIIFNQLFHGNISHVVRNRSWVGKIHQLRQALRSGERAVFIMPVAADHLVCCVLDEDTTTGEMEIKIFDPLNPTAADGTVLDPIYTVLQNLLLRDKFVTLDSFDSLNAALKRIKPGATLSAAKRVLGKTKSELFSADELRALLRSVNPEELVIDSDSSESDDE